MSTKYEGDERVRLSGDGLGYTLNGGEWQVRPYGGGFQLVDSDGEFISDDSGTPYAHLRPKFFATADEAIAEALGDRMVAS